MEVVVVVVLGICNRCALSVVLLHYFSQEYKRIFIPICILLGCRITPKADILIFLFCFSALKLPIDHPTTPKIVS